MKTDKKILILLVLSIFAGIIYTSWDDASSAEHEKHQKDKQSSFIATEILRIFGQRVKFYGIVLDQFDNPVPGTTIEYSLMDPENFLRAFGGGTPEQCIEKTDANGRFSISGIGGSLTCFAKHPDYYQTDQSSHSRGYAAREKKVSHDDYENPIVLRLYKKGACEPLYYSCSDVIGKGSSWIRIPEEGLGINLANGRIQEKPTSLHITYKNDRAQKNEIRYDWEYVLRIPGGGFRERNGDFRFLPSLGATAGYLKRSEDFSFIAPEDGYPEEVRIGFRKGEKDWKSGKICHYFVKFPNGLYGLLEIDAGASGNVRFQALINPDPASRNLEYDIRNQINKNSASHHYSSSF
ncbi:MAG: hypothetical protein IKW49_00430 [Opitutales bacterium]|nr:hypothetical protein [Opitutales bacterium]